MVLAMAGDLTPPAAAASRAAPAALEAAAGEGGKLQWKAAAQATPLGALAAASAGARRGYAER